MLRHTILTLSFIALSGCASKSTLEQQAKDKAAAAGVYAQAEARAISEQQQANQVYLSQVPDWVSSPKESDDTGVYAVGIGESDQLSTAISKARLRAEFGLASVFGSEVSGSQRSYTKDGTTEHQEYLELIDKILDAVPVTGFETTNSKVTSIAGKFVSFVELKMPFEEFNRILKQHRNSTLDSSVKAAFDDLEQRLERRRQQRLELQKQAQKPTSEQNNEA